VYTAPSIRRRADLSASGSSFIIAWSSLRTSVLSLPADAASH
jgi:hypothetical protein